MVTKYRIKCQYKLVTTRAIKYCGCPYSEKIPILFCGILNINISIFYLLIFIEQSFQIQKVHKLFWISIKNFFFVCNLMGILIDQKYNQLHLKLVILCNFQSEGINFGSYCRSTIHILFCSCISPGRFLNLFFLFFLPCLDVFPVKKM